MQPSTASGAVNSIVSPLSDDMDGWDVTLYDDESAPMIDTTGLQRDLADAGFPDILPQDL